MFTTESNKFKKEDLGDVTGKKKKGKYKHGRNVKPVNGNTQGGKTTIVQKAMFLFGDLNKAKVKTVNGVKTYVDGKHAGKRVGSVRGKGNAQKIVDAHEKNKGAAETYSKGAARIINGKKVGNSIIINDTKKKDSDVKLDEHLPKGYKTYTGAVMSDQAVASYNRATDKINQYKKEGRSVPENILNGRHNLFVGSSTPDRNNKGAAKKKVAEARKALIKNGDMKKPKQNVSWKKHKFVGGDVHYFTRDHADGEKFSQGRANSIQVEEGKNGRAHRVSVTDGYHTEVVGHHDTMSGAKKMASDFHSHVKNNGEHKKSLNEHSTSFIKKNKKERSLKKSFFVLPDLLKGKKITVPLRDMVDEHKKLVNVLESKDKKDDKVEAKKQKKELEGYKKKLNKDKKMSNKSLAKAIIEGLNCEFPDLTKGKKLEEKKEDRDLLEGLNHHMMRAKWKARSITNHAERTKELPEIKDAQKKHLALAKKYAKKLGIPEKEINDEVEGKTDLTDCKSVESESHFDGHYSDKKIES